MIDSECVLRTKYQFDVTLLLDFRSLSGGLPIFWKQRVNQEEYHCTRVSTVIGVSSNMNITRWSVIHLTRLDGGGRAGSPIAVT